jgi:MFS family permease
MVAPLDANVIKVAVPAIGRSLDATVTELLWTVTSYLLTVGMLLLLSGTAGPYAGGWLVDHASWRAVFLLSISRAAVRCPRGAAGAAGPVPASLCLVPPVPVALVSSCRG